MDFKYTPSHRVRSLYKSGEKIWLRIQRNWRFIAPSRRFNTALRAELHRLRQGKLPIFLVRPIESLGIRMLGIEAWTPPRDLDNQIKVYLSRENRPRRAIIYTAIIGNYDRLMIPEIIDPAFDYVCFSDRPIDGYGIWKIRPVPFYSSDPTRIARFVKTNPFMLLDEADFYVWMDGNVRLTGDLNTYLISDVAPIGLFSHPLRQTLNEEVKACIDAGKDETSVIHQQAERYKPLNSTDDPLPMFETNVVIAKFSTEARRFFDAWWREIDRHSRRDQLSVGYALKTSGTQYRHLLPKGLCARNHSDFQFIRHRALRSSSLPSSLTKHSQITHPLRDVRLEPRADLTLREASLDVIICVHNALDSVKNCLASLLSCDDTPDKVILVNDCSDEDTTRFLRSLSAEHPEHIALVENEANMGYTKSANIGLLSSNADLRILLNSDTIVSTGWLRKLSSLAFSDEKIGIVGPMSNAASYQSLPSIRRSTNQTAVNLLPDGTTVASVSQKCEEWSSGYHMAIGPLIHGFCFAIKSIVIESIGVFDEESFERFYGEENDYCFRAREAGFLLAVSTETFVFHEKSKSISEELRILHMDAAGQELRRKHGSKAVHIACTEMEHHPVLKHLREQASAEWDTLRTR